MQLHFARGAARPVTLAASACIMLLAGRAHAEIIDQRLLTLAYESTIVDMDMLAIAVTDGPDYNNTLAYSSVITDTGWMGLLSGVYAGNIVNIVYSGTVAPGFGPNTSLSHTSNWSYNGSNGNGSGSGQGVTGTNTFGIDLANLQVSGSVTVQYGVTTLSLSGSKTFSTGLVEVTGSAQAFSIGSLSLIGASVTFRYSQVYGNYSSYALGQVAHGYLYEKEAYNVGQIGVQPGTGGGLPPSGTPAHNTGQVGTTPAPGSLAVFGAFAIAGLRRRRQAV